MNPDDAEALVSVMQAEWLAGEWLDDSGELTTRGTMYALALSDFPPEVGAEAIDRMRKRIPYRQGPQTADLKATLNEVMGERTLATPALPSFDGVPACCRNQGFGHFYRDHADEDIKARVDKLLEMPKRLRVDEGVIREAFARVVGGKA
jgi:hypothetical protein